MLKKTEKLRPSLASTIRSLYLLYPSDLINITYNDFNACDTQSDKMSNATSCMENRTVCHTIRFLSY